MNILLTILVPLILLCLLAFILRFLFLFYRYLFFRPNIFGQDFASTLISIIIASLVTPALFSALFHMPFNIISESFSEIVTWIDKKNAEIDLTLATRYIIEFIAKIFKLVRLELLYLPAILGIALACLIGSGLKSMFYNSNTGTYELWHSLGQFYTKRIKTLSPEFKQKLVTSILLALSLYIVLCVIIAVPYNDNNLPGEQGSNGSDSTRLFTLSSSNKLDELKMSSVVYEKDTTDFFATISRNWPDKLTEEADKIRISNNEKIARDVRNEFERVKNRIDEFNTALDRLSKNKTDIISSFQKKINGLSENNRLKEIYAQQLQTYIDAEVQYLYGVFAQERSQIESDYKYIFRNSILQNILDNYGSFINWLKNTEAPALSGQNSVMYFPQVLSFPSRSGYTLPQDIAQNPPPPPNSGTDWGWPGKIASWLIKPKNKDLVLIIGMFGFGMLGAAISNIVNSTNRNRRSRHIVNDFHIVVIRGFVAAIIIFLATKGGIAVINTGSNNPNPHFLFFTCLVGAVFSDRIWEWAKKQVTFKTDNKTANQPNTTAPPTGDDPYQTESSSSRTPPSQSPPPEGAIPSN